MRSVGWLALGCALCCAFEPESHPAAIVWLIVANVFLAWRKS